LINSHKNLKFKNPRAGFGQKILFDKNDPKNTKNLLLKYRGNLEFTSKNSKESSPTYIF